MWDAYLILAENSANNVRSLPRSPVCETNDSDNNRKQLHPWDYEPHR